MPNQPKTQRKTPLRSVPVPDEIWKPAQAKAAERGESLSEVVRRALVRYANRQ